MDTNKWKSVLVPKHIYDAIKETARSEGRTISGQLTMVFEFYKRNHKPEITFDNNDE